MGQLLQILNLVGRRLRGQTFAGPGSQLSRRYKPGVEALEDRSLPSALSPFSKAPVLPSGHFAHANTHHHVQAAPVEILTPASGSVVNRYLTVTGTLLGHAKGWPVVLVQPVLAGEPWYVQPEVLTVKPDGSFSVSVYIGNAATPPNTAFRIEVILAKDHAQAHKLFPEGSTLKTLPAGLPASQVVLVTRASAPSRPPVA